MGTTEPITIRRGAPKDGKAAFRVLWESANDLARRIGADPIPGTVESSYSGMQMLFEHLAETAAEFWVAVDPSGDLCGDDESREHFRRGHAGRFRDRQNGRDDGRDRT